MKAKLGYLAAGIVVGAAVSVVFALRSGEETRGFLANKCFDAIQAANQKVWQSRFRIREIMNRSQQQISRVVEVGRETFTPKACQSPVTVL